jgi:nicotinamidase-related amidase
MNEPPQVPLCRRDDGVLAVVDVQARLAAAMPADALSMVLRNVRRLLDAAGLLAVPVIRAEQYPAGLGATVPEVAGGVPPRSPLIEKTAFSACGADGFGAALADAARPQVVLAGMEAHVCVLQTALELAASGREVYVVEDAVCSRDPANKANGLARLRQAGIRVASTESVLFEWLRDADHPRFRDVSALIR